MTNPEYVPGKPDDIAFRKKKLRGELRHRFAQVSCDSAAVVRNVLAFLKDSPGISVVAIYSALPGEVDLGKLVDDRERIWVFPKVVGESLVFHRVTNLSNDLVPGAFGILEPREGLKTYGTMEVDLFLCPGLGFDPEGRRLGRGRGFYDRMLAAARPDAVKAGVCFPFQLVEKIDTEPHDIPMDGVISG